MTGSARTKSALSLSPPILWVPECFFSLFWFCLSFRHTSIYQRVGSPPDEVTGSSPEGLPWVKVTLLTCYWWSGQWDRMLIISCKSPSVFMAGPSRLTSCLYYWLSSLTLSLFLSFSISLSVFVLHYPTVCETHLTDYLVRCASSFIHISSFLTDIYQLSNIKHPLRSK